MSSNSDNTSSSVSDEYLSNSSENSIDVDPDTVPINEDNLEVDNIFDNSSSNSDNDPDGDDSSSNYEEPQSESESNSGEDEVPTSPETEEEVSEEVGEPESSSESEEVKSLSSGKSTHSESKSKSEEEPIQIVPEEVVVESKPKKVKSRKFVPDYKNDPSQRDYDEFIEHVKENWASYKKGYNPLDDEDLESAIENTERLRSLPLPKWCKKRIIPKKELPDQVNSIDRILSILETSSYCTLIAPTGTGKTFMSLGACMALNLEPFCIGPVNSEGNIRIVMREYFRGLDDNSITYGKISNKKEDSTHNNFMNYSRRKNRFIVEKHFLDKVEKGICLIVDEVQLTKNYDTDTAEAIAEIVKPILENHMNGGRSRVIFMSATPFDVIDQVASFLHIVGIFKYNFTTTNKTKKQILKQMEDLIELVNLACDRDEEDTRLKNKLLKNLNTSNAFEMVGRLYKIVWNYICVDVKGFNPPYPCNFYDLQLDVSDKYKRKELLKNLGILSDMNSGKKNKNGSQKNLTQILSTIELCLLEDIKKIVLKKLKTGARCMLTLNYNSLPKSRKDDARFIELFDYFENEGYEANYITGSVKDRMGIAQRFRECKDDILLINTVAGSTAINCQNTSCPDKETWVFILCTTYSAVGAIQAVGRNIRLGGVGKSVNTVYVWPHVEGDTRGSMDGVYNAMVKKSGVVSLFCSTYMEPIKFPGCTENLVTNI